MRRTFLLLSSLWILLGVGYAQSADEVRIAFDPATTRVEFTLGDVLHTVHGTFKLKSGSIEFNRATGAASGLLTVDVASGESGNSSRDRKMHREILQSDKYPDATFAPQQVLGQLALQGSSQVQVKGVFRIHGADHELTLDVPVQVSGDQLKLKTQFIVPFVRWGMKDPSTFVLRVNKEVQMSISGAEHITSAAQVRTSH